MRLDPLAALRCWTVDVDIGGVTYTIPPMTADGWLVPILGGSWTDIVPGLLVDTGDLADLLLDGEVSYEEVRAVARDALTEAAGMKWWIATQLAHVASSTWVAAELTLRGVDPARVSLGAWLGAAHRAATRNMEKTDLAQFDFELERPPDGVPPEEWFDEEEAANSFVAAMAADGQ